MTRRKALAVAAAISTTGMSAALAIGANFGLFGLAAQPSEIGNFTATPAAINETAAARSAQPSTPATDPVGSPGPSPAPDVEVIYIDEPPTLPPPAVGASAQGLARAAEVTPPQANVPAQTPVGLPHAARDDHDDDAIDDDSNRGCSNSGHGNCEDRGGDEDHDDDDD
jgi:putative hemolysin